MISSLQFTHKMLWQTLLEVRGVPRGEAQDVPVLPPPPAMCIPPSPAWKAGYEKRCGSVQQEKNPGYAPARSHLLVYQSYLLV